MVRGLHAALRSGLAGGLPGGPPGPAPARHRAGVVGHGGPFRWPPLRAGTGADPRPRSGSAPYPWGGATGAPPVSLNRKAAVCGP